MLTPVLDTFPSEGELLTRKSMQTPTNSETHSKPVHMERSITTNTLS